MNSAMIQTRIDAKQKVAAENLFKSMGTTLNNAIRMFIVQSLREGRMPFTPSAEEYYPNAETRDVIDNADFDNDTIHLSSKEELFKELDL